MKNITSIFVVLLFSLTTFAQQLSLKPDSDVPFDANVRTGTLPNGLKYYIRKNAKPEHRAELRLVVNAGSVMETDGQQGLAHLTEHMCFDGTKNFQKSAIIDFIESSGMTFGADLNAYTAFDQTVYMLKIPTDTPAILQKGIQVLEDWAHNVTFDNAAIDKERKVVVEEWRLGQGADERMFRKYFPVEFYSSQYGLRDPIGKKEIIEGAPYDTLKQFYKDWYRPDLQAIVAVGDFDIDQVEKMIKEGFSTLTNPQNERPRKVFAVPDAPDLMVSVCTDKEAAYTSIQLLYKHALTGKKLVNDYREDVKRGLFSAMLNDRYRELTQKNFPPFAFAGADFSDIAKSKSAYENVAYVSDSGVELGLKTLLDENNRVKKFGFTATELEREKKSVLRDYEEAFNEKDKTESLSYTEEYVRNFLTGESSPGIDWEYQAVKQMLATITLDEVNQLAGDWITDGKNCVIIVTAPDKASVKIPSEDKIKQIFKTEQQTSIVAYNDKVITKPLLDKKPKGGKVVKETTNTQDNITEWTLSNGAKVILKPTDFKNDEILFSAYSFGGTSLYPDKDNMSASLATDIIENSGVGPFDATQLSKYLSDKVVQLSPRMDETTQSFNGSASPKDLETLLQMMYLYFTSPRKDSVGFKSMMSKEISFIQNRTNDPGSALQDTVEVVMHRHNFRYRPVNEKVLSEADMNRAYQVFKERFSDAGGFTYVFVGNFKPADIKPLIEMYIGGLSSQNKNETFKDLGIRPPSGLVTKSIIKGTEPKSTVEMVYNGPFDYNVKNRTDVNALLRLMNIRLYEVLRKDMSGVYGVYAWPILMHYPQPMYKIGVYFGCAPENVDKLIAATMTTLDSIKQFGCSDKDLVKIKEQSLKERETNLKENDFWLNTITSCCQNKEDVAEVHDFDKQIQALTSDDFKKIANQYLAQTNFAQFILNPEKK